MAAQEVAGIILSITLKREALILAAVIAVAVVGAAADPLPCPIYTPPVPLLEVWIYHAHAEPLIPFALVDSGRLYTASDVLALAAGYYEIRSEGHPVAVKWRAGKVKHVCGEMPAQIFEDDFELDHLHRWSATQGE